MTIFVGSAYRQVGSLLVTAAWLSMLSTAAVAYTAEQQQACSGDAVRLCSAEIPDVDRVTVCMVRNKSQLSPGCRVHFRPEGQSATRVGPVIAGSPLSIRPSLGSMRDSAKQRRVKPNSER